MRRLWRSSPGYPESMAGISATPSAASRQPPAASRQPPARRRPPPAASRQPPAASRHASPRGAVRGVAAVGATVLPPTDWTVMERLAARGALWQVGRHAPRAGAIVVGAQARARHADASEGRGASRSRRHRHSDEAALDA